MSDLRELPLENALSRTYRADLGILFIRWKCSAGSALLRQGYELCLNEAAACGSRFWFLDLRRRGPALPEDEHWIRNTFLPGLEKRIPGRHYLAYLVSPTHQHALHCTVGLLTGTNFSEQIRIQVFNAENQALNWLRECRHTEATLA